MNKKTSSNINNLRWYLCLIVVVGHFTKIFFGVFDNALITWSGFIAVCGFMLLSGYVNHHSLSSSDSISTFLHSRAKRILIPFYIALSFSLFILWIFNMEIKTDYLLNFILIQHVFSVSPVSSNEPLWTISYEVILYILFALSYKDRILKSFSILFTFFLLFYLNNPYFIIFYCLFYIGVLLSHFKVELDLFSIPFFIQKNLTYEIYLFHYPVFLVVLRLIS